MQPVRVLRRSEGPPPLPHGARPQRRRGRRRRRGLMLEKKFDNTLETTFKLIIYTVKSPTEYSRYRLFGSRVYGQIGFMVIFLLVLGTWVPFLPLATLEAII